MKKEIIVDQRRVNAFYRTSLVVSVIVELLRCKRVRDEPAYSKVNPDGTRKLIRGVRASCIYHATEALGIPKGKTKEILDAMVMKSRFLERQLAVLVPSTKDGPSKMTYQEYVYELVDRDEIDEAVINALACLPEIPYHSAEIEKLQKEIE